MSKAELEVLASKLDDSFAKNGYAVTPEVVQMARQLDGITARVKILAIFMMCVSMPSLRHPLPDKSSS